MFFGCVMLPTTFFFVVVSNAVLLEVSSTMKYNFNLYPGEKYTYLCESCDSVLIRKQWGVFPNLEVKVDSLVRES